MKKLTAIALSLFMAVSLTSIHAEENVGWQKEAGTYYYFEKGQKKTGWFKDQNCWYYLDSATGSMKTGWVTDNEYWYFLGKSGIMQTNTWIESNGNRYFIQGNGIMAADTVKDGYELDSDGKAVPLSESKSELYDSNIDYSGKVIEGNLYINAENKEVELKNVTIKNKLVVYGEKQAEIKVNLIDSTIDTLSFQQKNIEITLSGKTTVKNVLFEEGGSIKKDKDYKGSIENITIRSAVKQSVEIDVSTKNIEVNNYAGCIIKSKVDELIINRKSEVQFKARVKNVIVSDEAKDSILTISRASTITELTGNASFKADGEGTVNTLFANAEDIEFGEDLYLLKVVKGIGINDTPKIHKRPISSSSNSNDSNEEKPDEPEYDPETTVVVTNADEFMTALIGSKENIYIAPQTYIRMESFFTSLSNKTLIIKGTLDLTLSSLYLNKNATLKVDGGTIKLTGSTIYFHDSTSKLILVENDNEYILKLKKLIPDQMYIKENTLTIGRDSEFENLDVLTKFGSLFNTIIFNGYDNDIKLINLENINIIIYRLMVKIELQGSSDLQPIILLNIDFVPNDTTPEHLVIGFEPGYYPVEARYDETGTLNTLALSGKIYIFKDTGAILVGDENENTELCVKDGPIDVSNSAFYLTKENKEENKPVMEIDEDSPTFEWDKDEQCWFAQPN